VAFFMNVKTFMLLFMLVDYISWPALHLHCQGCGAQGHLRRTAESRCHFASGNKSEIFTFKQGLLASQPNIILNHCLLSSGGCHDHKHKALRGEYAHAHVTSTPLRSPHCASKSLGDGVLVLQGMLGCVDLFLRSLLIHAGY